MKEEEKLPEGLEEAAWQYAEQEIKTWGSNEPNERKEIHDDFIVGAKWDRAKMMEKAVDGRVIKSYNPVTAIGQPTLHGIELIYPDMDKPYIIAGDTVKVIFIPEKSEKVK